jgi:hypothetical protein
MSRCVRVRISECTEQKNKEILIQMQQETDRCRQRRKTSALLSTCTSTRDSVSTNTKRSSVAVHNEKEVFLLGCGAASQSISTGYMMGGTWQIQHISNRHVVAVVPCHLREESDLLFLGRGARISRLR